MIELVALDIAGTTVEEHSAVYVALEECVVAAGARPGPADIRNWMGAGKREAITGLLTHGASVPSDDLVDATFADFRERLDRKYRDDPPRPFPGVTEALQALRAHGVKVALTTGFDREVTGKLLAGIGWDGNLLDAVVCIDDVPAGRPAPYMIFRAMEACGVLDVADVLVAGDTVRDLQAGRNAGAGMIVGVLTGGVPADVLTGAPHTHITDGVADIPALLGFGL